MRLRGSERENSLEHPVHGAVSIDSLPERPGTLNGKIVDPSPLCQNRLKGDRLVRNGNRRALWGDGSCSFVR